MGKTVAVIGGGLGALSASIRLARLGFRVKLFEKNNYLGGKMNEFRHQAYRFDTGPSLLTMPFIIDELFHFTGLNRSRYLQFYPVEPVCKYFFPDGSRFSTSTNLITMLENLELTFPKEKAAYINFLEYSGKIFHTAAELFLFTPWHEASKLIQWKTLHALGTAYRIDPFRTVHQGVSRFFSDPRLIQIFDRYATYNGSNPFRAPATLNIIPYVEYELGSFYIAGGMYRLIHELERIARELGVEIQTAAEVDKIAHIQGKVTGLWVAGELVPADYIVSGSDVVNTFEKLIEGYEKRRKKLVKLEPSLSGLVFLWGIKKQHSELHHHNIFFSADYRKEFSQIFEEHRIPEDPTIYVSITSKSDPDHAPPNCENWFVLLNLPYLTSVVNWHTEIEKIRQVVLTKLKAQGLDLSASIELEKVYTPDDFQKLYHSNRGSIYGISSNSRLTAFRRPANRDRSLSGLYFAGGSVHPGGGIPLALLSGKMVAELIGEKEKLIRYNSGTIRQFLMQRHRHPHNIFDNLE